MEETENIKNIMDRIEVSEVIEEVFKKCDKLKNFFVEETVDKKS